MSDAGVSVGASCTCAIIPSVFEQTEYKAMNMDQWTGFLHFCEEVEIKPDLSNYDESQAWPLLVDNYVEWARKCTMISL